MKTFSDLKTAVQKANSPEQAAGTFIDGLASILDGTNPNQSSISQLATDLRGNRQNFVHSLTGSGKTNTTV